ncbi:uncharacterized protein IL334_004508 [Kwoniella shivajii]|uniref:Phosphoglycerate mutase n=1 Tax=Kwoniella shivajii TaxID=564305 RepID=A0ABZ1D3I5_9TREE|nr:hypothetical protein IL334_004508 [Kwoniella shivajii]
MLSMFKTLLALAVPLGLLVLTSSVYANPTPSYQPSYSNRIVFIRHAEKGFAPDQIKKKASDGQSSLLSLFWPPWRHAPRRGGPGRMPNGLSDKGRERAQYIRTLFGRESEFEFGLIFAAPRTPQEKETERTYATVAPLANDLGLEIDIECANSEYGCVVSHVNRFVEDSDADILISWKHRDLNGIATALGASNANKIYPDERNDVIWIMQNGRIIEKRSMHCPGLDDHRIDQNDPDLEVESDESAYWRGWHLFRDALPHLW